MSYRYVGDGEKDDIDVDHRLSGYELSSDWEWFKPGTVGPPADTSAEAVIADPFEGFTVAELDAVISATDMPVDKSLRKAPKAVAILAALVDVVKADD